MGSLLGKLKEVFDRTPSPKSRKNTQNRRHVGRLAKSKKMGSDWGLPTNSIKTPRLTSLEKPDLVAGGHGKKEKRLGENASTEI